MDEPVLVVMTLVGLGLAVGAAMYFNPAAIVKRKLRKLPVEQIGRLEAGKRVRLTGKIAAEGQLLEAPLSGKNCVWYQATVEEYRSHGKKGRWHIIVKDEQHCDFVVEDATGRCRVRMMQPKVASTLDHGSKSGTFDDPTPKEAAFLERHGRSGTGLLGLNRRLRYQEQVLEAGEAVTVLGKVRSTGESWGSLLPELEADPELGLLLSDDPGTLGG